MGINIYHERDNVKHISVNGVVDSKKEREMLIEQLEDVNCIEISITFFDASILHSDLVEKIYYNKKIKKCKVYAFKKYLYSYLYRLGIACEYVESKSLRSSGVQQSEYEVPIVEDIKNFMKLIYSKYGYDYSGYQIDSIIRRIRICMLRENIRNFEEFKKAVLNDEEVFEDLFHDLSINTTEFFRDPEIYWVLKSKILPYLDSYNHIKIWCAGCSNGKEAYSIAIFLEELGLLKKSQIYATDINLHVIEEAKNGLYAINDLEKEILNYKSAGGKRSFVDYLDLNDSYIKIKSYLKDNILFFQHSLIESGSLNEFVLIICRNVMIYFNPELQSKVLKVFSNSLDRSGFLVLGKSEGLILNGGNEYFNTLMGKERIYKVRQ